MIDLHIRNGNVYFCSKLHSSDFKVQKYNNQVEMKMNGWNWRSIKGKVVSRQPIFIVNLKSNTMKTRCKYSGFSNTNHTLGELIH